MVRYMLCEFDCNVKIRQIPLAIFEEYFTEIMKEKAAPPAIRGILETSLYVENLDRSCKFYQKLFDMEILYSNEKCRALNVAGNQVLLLFKKGESLTPITTPGGVIPPSEGGGHLHLAFAIAEQDIERWIYKLDDAGVKIESKVDWKQGGQSLYFRDPDEHLIELISPGCWSIY